MKKPEEPVGIVLVTYYLESPEEAERLIAKFCKASDLKCARSVIIDNSGAITKPHNSTGSTCRHVAGDNTHWEFSGWVQGLNEAREWSDLSSVILLNDSFHRNWSISHLTKWYLARMHTASTEGNVAAWLDNFSFFRKPRFARRPNSRIVFLPPTKTEAVKNSIEYAIAQLQNNLEHCRELFDPDEKLQIESWISSQPERWSRESLPTRTQRIFLEHHMLEQLAGEQVRWFPQTSCGSTIYALSRRLLRERR